MINVPQLIGDAIDRAIILILKIQRCKDYFASAKAMTELITLCASLNTKKVRKLLRAEPEVFADLLDINSQLWNLEIAIRQEPTIEKIRKVHELNATRSALKNTLNKEDEYEVKDYT